MAISAPRQGRRRGPARAGLLLLILVLAGCETHDPEPRLDDYLNRLARTVDEPRSNVSVPARDAPPRSASLQRPIAGSRLDGLDFLRLSGCALQTTVARRNSSLGRQAPPSQRLLLELAFLRQAPACIDKLSADGDAELASLLASARELKLQQLPALVFNATLGGSEYRDFWRSAAVVADYPAQTGSAVITALEYVSAAAALWLGGVYEADEQAFELALATIARGDGGELLAALTLQLTYLDEGSSLLRRRGERGPLCEAGRVPAAAPILRTVAQKYFVAGVQPWSAALNQRYHQLLPALFRLEAALENTLPESYRNWQNGRDARFTAALAAPARHVRRLQNLLGTCYAEFRPAQAPSF